MDQKIIISSLFQNLALFFPAIKVCKKTSTKVLLENNPKKLPQKIFDPLKLLQNTANYDQKRIGNALLYAKFTLYNPTWKLSSIGMRALLLYKNACARFLEMEARETFDKKDKNVEAARNELIATIRMYKKLM